MIRKTCDYCEEQIQVERRTIHIDDTRHFRREVKLQADKPTVSIALLVRSEGGDICEECADLAVSQIERPASPVVAPAAPRKKGFFEKMIVCKDDK